MKRIAKIKGMHCNDCVERVEGALKKAGYKVGKVELESGIAEFECGCTDTCHCPDPVNVISSAGYEVVEVKEV